MLRDVVFDFYGTLVEYRPEKVVDPDERRAHELLLAHGIALGFEEFRDGLYQAFEEHELEARRTLVEPHMHDIARGFLARRCAGAVPAGLPEEFSRVFCEEWGGTSTAVDGLEALLDALGPRFRLSIVSNTFYPPLIHATLARLGLTDRFAAVHTSAELGIRKPHRRIFEIALAAIGARPGEALYVGDSYGPDYEGAMGAGMAAFLIDPQERYPVPAQHRLHRLADLSGALAQIGEF
jgi:putative hydrolase of the HAD superfamily